MTYDPFGNEINENDMKENTESPEKGKPFLTDEEETIAANEYVSHIENPIYTASIKEEIKGDFIAGRRSGFNAAAEKANKRIEELAKEIERLQYWQNEKDQEADAERVSIAVGDAEIELHEKILNELHNKIMVQWEKDFGSIHNEQKMDAYTISGFVKEAIKNL